MGFQNGGLQHGIEALVVPGLDRQYPVAIAIAFAADLIDEIRTALRVPTGSNLFPIDLRDSVSYSDLRQGGVASDGRDRHGALVPVLS